MIDINIEEMMEAGAHFGHQTRRWNPKMKPYIYGARSGVHILDLDQTQQMARKAINSILDIVGNGADVLFVGTKKQAQPVIEEEAKRCSMPYVTKRWLGGMLTNFGTIRKSVERLIELETKREKNDFEGLTKKEKLGIDRQIKKLEMALGGIKNMRRVPGAVFVVDPQEEKIAVHEANVLGIPVIAITDSNCNPDPVNYVIPANDDSIRSIKVFVSKIAEACLQGLEKREALAREGEGEDRRASKKKLSRKAQEIKGTGRAYVSKVDTYEGAEEMEGFSASVEKEEPSPEESAEEESAEEESAKEGEEQKKEEKEEDR